MSGDIQFGLKVSYDGKAVASGVTANADQIKAFGETAKRAGEQASASLDRTAISAKQTAAALRGVPAQFTDIVTSIAAGQNPMQVMLQQGGQLKDMFGGVGPAARALGGYIAGLVNPFTVAAAAAAGLAYVYHQGSQESDAYTRNLILSGNAAGTTATQMEEAARRIARATGGTQGAAAGALAQGIAGGVPGSALAAVAEAAVRMEQVTGKAIDDTVAEFAKLARDPVAASRKLDEQYNYLTASTFRQIKALAEQGRTSDAAALAMRTYAAAVVERTGEITRNLGIIESRWLSLKAIMAGGLDWVKGIGRPDDALEAAADKVMKLRNNIRALEQSKWVPPGELEKRRELLRVAEAEMVAIRNKASAENAAAESRAAAVAKEKAGIKDADKRHKTDNGLDDAAREQAKSYAQQYEAIAKLARGVEAEAAAGEKLLPVERALAEARLTLNDAQVREIEQAAAGALLIEQRAKAEKEAAEQAKIYTSALRAQIGPLEERMRHLATERENAGKTEAEINALAIARLEEARAIAAANGAQEQHLDFYDREIAARRQLGDELALQKQAQEDWLAGAKAGLTDYARTVEDRAGQTRRAWSSTWKRAEDDLANALAGGEIRVKDWVRMALVEFNRIAIVQPFIAKLAGFATGAIDKLFGGSGGGASTGGIGGMVEYTAKGNVFASPDLHRYANTVVDTPTRFRFAKGAAIGEMGEAGPEGIMPLKRDKQGRLGVIAEGGGGINLTYAPVFEIDARGAAVGVGPMLQGVVEAAVQRSRAEMLSELSSGGALAVATGRRRG